MEEEDYNSWVLRELVGLEEAIKGLQKGVEALMKVNKGRKKNKESLLPRVVEKGKELASLIPQVMEELLDGRQDLTYSSSRPSCLSVDFKIKEEMEEDQEDDTDTYHYEDVGIFGGEEKEDDEWGMGMADDDEFQGEGGSDYGEQSHTDEEDDPSASIIEPRNVRNYKGRGRKWDPVWNDFIAKRDQNGRIISVKCRKCGVEVSPKAPRLRGHLNRCKGNSSNPSGTQKVRTAKFTSVCRLNKEKVQDNDKDRFDDGGEQNTVLDEETGFETTTRPDTGSSTRRRGRRWNPVWRNFIARRWTNGKIISATCRNCGKHVSPRSERLKSHLNYCKNGANSSSFCDTSSVKSNPELDKSLSISSSSTKPDGLDSSNLVDNDAQQSDIENAESEEELVGTSNSVKAKRGKGGRNFDPVWNNFIKAQGSNGKIIGGKCRKCGKLISPRAGRLKTHLDRCT